MADKKRQKGLASVEFALVSVALFGMIFSIIDFGRWMYTYNLLQEVTRRTAETAVKVFPDAAGQTTAIKAGLITSSGSSSTTITDLKSSHIELVYLNADGDVIAAPAQCANYDRIRYVRARLQQGNAGYTFKFVLPVNLIGFPKEVIAPPFEVILPRESLGWSSAGTPCT